MAIAFGLAAGNVQGAVAFTITVTIPAVSANDFVVVTGISGAATDPVTLTSTGTTPTQLGSSQSTASAVQGLWYFVASGSDSGKVLTLTTTTTLSKMAIGLVSYTGVLTSAPIDVSAVANAPGGSSSTHTCPTLTTVTDQDWILQVLTVKDSQTTSWTSPGTLRESQIGTGAGQSSVLMTDGNGPVSLSTLQGGGSFVSGQSIASANDVAWTLALSPASSGTSATAGLASATGVPPALNDSITLNMTIQGV